MVHKHIERLAAFNAILVIISALFLFSMSLTFPLSYPEFISGNVTWSAASKFQDLVIMPIVLLGGFIFFIIINVLFKRLSCIDRDKSQKLAIQIILWSLPAFSTISGLLIHKGIEELFLLISLIGIITITLVGWFSVKCSRPINIEKISIGLLMVLFASIIPLSLSAVINIAPLALSGGGISVHTIKNWVAAFYLIGFLGYLYCVLLKYEFYEKNLSNIVLFSQTGLALLFLTLYPSRLLETGSNITAYDTTIYLKLLVVALVSLTLIDILYRYIKYRKGQFSFKIISPMAIIGLIIALRFGNTVSPGISPDDYHFGENLLGWWTYLHGYIPYIDFMPAHGIINNDFAGFISVIFYDGTAASLGESQRIAFALLALMAFICVYHVTNSLLISFISIYFLGGRIIWLFLVLFAAIWFRRSLIENKVKWSIVWLLTAPLVILGVPPQGLLLVAASAVIPIYFLWVAISNREWSVIKPVFFSFLVIFILYALTPLGQMLVSAVSYVLINGPINQIAYGIPWSASFNGQGFLFELVRMSWVIVPAVMLFFLYFLFQNNRFNHYYVLPIVSVFLFSLLLIPYSMGRIDPGSFSRPGLVGILLISGFMGLVLWNVLRESGRIWLIYFTVFLVSVVKFVPVSMSPLLSSTTAYINVGPLAFDQSGLLTNVGHAQVRGDHWTRLNRLALLLDRKLLPEETYLDLTSRNAQYFYLNRKPIIPDTAPYNMASYLQQDNAIKRLRKNLPRLALIEGDNIIHDGGGLALRNHYLYRFVLEHYEPFEVDGFVIGLSKEALARGDWAGVLPATPLERVELFEKAFSRHRIDLHKLPVSWGNSRKKLSPRMQVVSDQLSLMLSGTHDVQTEDTHSFRVTGPDPFIVFDLSSLSLSGQGAGLLMFEFHCQVRSQVPRLQIFWWGESQSGPLEESSLFITADNGWLIVPLDAAPRWYLLEQVKGLRIDLDNSQACQSFSIDNVSLNLRN